MEQVTHTGQSRPQTQAGPAKSTARLKAASKDWRRLLLQMQKQQHRATSSMQTLYLRKFNKLQENNKYVNKIRKVVNEQNEKFSKEVEIIKRTQQKV